MTAEAAARSANVKAGEVAIRLVGKGYALRPSFEAIAEFEQATGRGLCELAQRGARGELSTLDLASIICAGLRAAGETRATPEKVGEMVFRTGVASCLAPVVTLLLGCLNGGQVPDEDYAPGEATAAEATSA